MKIIIAAIFILAYTSISFAEMGPGVLPPGEVDINQLLLESINALYSQFDALIGVTLALIVAVTWKG